jgi:hypothetical protein
MTRYALCLFLLCASAMASARDVRMHGPNGDGGACSEPAAAPPAAAPPAHATSTAVRPAKVKAPPLFRGSDDDASPHMPRWHSFLPGMFR